MRKGRERKGREMKGAEGATRRGAAEPTQHFMIIIYDDRENRATEKLSRR